LITYPHEDGKERGILRKLVQRLEAKGQQTIRTLIELRLTKLLLTGLIPPDGVLTFSQPATLRTTRANKRASSFDSLDKALVIFKHPANGTTRKRDIYRRGESYFELHVSICLLTLSFWAVVDLITAGWMNWGAALVGWSGSTQLERDLRIHAERMGYKFDSGALRDRTTGEVIRTMHEKDVFRALKLKWIRK